ncbi:hypothetical protein BCR32DRAFT_264561 [Anaeromyces robustus]|uniref:Nuclear pore complex protein Nup153 n=1 Tax=Anaeromyces robustus TaxID=1754192 RepID=A0A1Y1XNJ0_9FUNG|nr:hypothetical protein BCR32DRAFT_264561 [Anaeromyces robustus]|eukprot:ORX87076.1 hypothetical protein BCR32DRAFT_264561 [Anaeromyces robustus]
MLNRFKSVFSPKKTKKQNLKYSPYERNSPRNTNKERIKENFDDSSEIENKPIEVEYEKQDSQILKNNVLFNEKCNKKKVEEKENESKNDNQKLIENTKKVNENHNIENPISKDKIEVKTVEKDVIEKKDEKKKKDVIEDEKSKNKRIKLSTFHYYGTGYSRNSQPYMPARRLQTKKSSVLFYKKKLPIINKEKSKNEKESSSIPEISHTAKLILDVVEKEEKKYKKPMKMKKLEKKSSKSEETEKKSSKNNENKSQDEKKNVNTKIKRITPINISGPKSNSQFNFVRKSSSYASHPEIVELTKKLSSETADLPKFTFERQSSSYSLDGSDKKKSEEKDNKSEKESSSKFLTANIKPVSTGFNWAAAGMTKPTLAAGEWKCSVCDAKNKESDDKCVCCEEPNPNKKSSNKSNEAPKITFGVSSSNASTITFGSKPADTKTNETKSTTTTTTGFNWAAAGMTKPTLAAGEWKCSVCDAKNKESDDKCVCCEEPNPNKKASDNNKPNGAPKFTFGSSSTNSTITFGKPIETNKTNDTKTTITFGSKPADAKSTTTTTTGFNWAAAGMTKPTLAADEWKCSVCDAKNKESDDKCVCCEEPNPNKKASDNNKPNGAPKFTFGSSSTNSTITFGKPIEANKTNDTKTTITFGSKPAEAKTNETKSTTTTTTGFNWATAGMTKPTLAAGEWKCSVCDAKNKESDDKCVCCEEPNPNKKTSNKSNEAPKITFGVSSSNASTITFGSKPADSKTNETKSITTTTTGFNWAAAGMTKPTLAAGEWKCSVCDAKNKESDDKCVCCEEPNPNKKASDNNKPNGAPKFTFGSSSTNSTITFGKPIETNKANDTKTTITFGSKPADTKTNETKSTTTTTTTTGFNWAAAGMTKPTLAADEWKCSVCDAKNKESDDKCVCCEEPNPNKKASDNKPNGAPKFTFGSSSTNSTITFGKPIEANKTNDTKTTITFGSKPADAKTNETKSTSTTTTTTGFNWAAAGMTKPTLAAGEWKCSVCDAKNKESDDKCVCCEEPNPNKKSSDNNKPNGALKFTFGNVSSFSNNSNSKPNVTFGLTSINNNNSSSITFGQQNNSTSSTTTGFGFGQPFGSKGNNITFGNNISTSKTTTTSKPIGFSFNKVTANGKTTTTTSFTTSNSTTSNTTNVTSTTKPINGFSFVNPQK